MNLETLADVRSEIARRRLTRQSVAEAMGRTPYSVSHLMSWDEDVVLSPRGRDRFSKAIRDAEAAAQKQGAA